MPELPEVETVRAGLEPVIVGQIIERADIRRADLRWPFPERMQERLEGASIKRLGRRSKYLLADLSTGETLLMHLGMSGRILVQGAAVGAFCHPITPLEKHDHVVLDFDGGARLVFNDSRRFGAMDLCSSAEIEKHRLLRSLGPEPLGNSLNAEYLMATLKGRTGAIKAVLLDQRIIAGLGNIYVCEALWRAGISPTRKAGRVSRSRIETLTLAIRDVIRDAIVAGGSSLRDYRQADGELGYFQHSFAAYGREGEKCANPECSAQIRRIEQSGRSSYYCPKCQR